MKNQRHVHRVHVLAAEVAREISRSGIGQKIKEAASDPNSRYLLGMPDWEYLLAQTIERAIGEHGARVRNEHLYEYATTAAGPGEPFEPPGGGGWEYLEMVSIGPVRGRDGKLEPFDYIAVSWRRPVAPSESR